MYVEASAAPKTSKRKGRRKRKSNRQYPDMTGRRVLVDAEYFSRPHDDPYAGLVHKWTSYRNNKLEKLWGYDIHYDVGDEYYMLEVDVHKYLVPESESSSASVGITPPLAPTHTRSHHHHHHHQLTTIHTIGVADEYGMDDADYDFVDRLEVQEDNGTWQTATIHRHKITNGVCLFFGGSDYEGLPDLYTFVEGVLKDGDGEEITTRVIVDGNGNNNNDNSSSQENVCDVIDVTVDEGIPDHESEMYMGDGVKPDWITDDLQILLDEM